MLDTTLTQKVVLLLDDDVYEEPTCESYEKEFRRAFGDRIKLVQFFSASDAFDYLVSNKVHLIVSSMIEYGMIEPYDCILGGGDIFIMACNSLYKEVPFIVFASSEDKANFFKYNVPDAYINKGTDLTELFSKIETLIDGNVSTEETNYTIEYEDLDTLTELAYAYLLLHQYEKSKHICHKILQTNSVKKVVYYYLGASCFGMNDFHEASIYLKIATKKLPQHADAHCYLGYTFLSLEMYKDASEYGELAIKLNPKQYSSYLLLGKAYKGLGMNTDAMKSFRKAAKLRPNLISSWLFLAEIYLMLDMNKEAFVASKRAVKIGPYNTDAQFYLGVAYLRKGMYKKASDTYNKLLTVNPDDQVSHYNLGITYMKWGKMQEATDAYKKAIKINPDYQEAYHNLGIVYMDSGRNKEAIDAFKQLLRINPEHVDGHFSLGKTCWVELQKNKLFKELEQELRTLNKIKPERAISLREFIAQSIEKPD